ncbi:MAG: hypothetical protein HYU36_00365 [Planctomycetes bacterium]|nr:hypothetical protein [Planctomycetota bacterium]
MRFITTAALLCWLDWTVPCLAGSVSTPRSLGLNLSTDRISENAGPGAATGTVRRDMNSANFDQPLVVSLTSSDTTEVTVPAKVTIPAGVESADFLIDAVDDTTADGVVAVSIRASAVDLLSAYHGCRRHGHHLPGPEGGYRPERRDQGLHERRE